MRKNYFKDINWERVRNKQIDMDVPYKPNAMKYRYLL
jgi:hypothetical protein